MRRRASRGLRAAQGHRGFSLAELLVAIAVLSLIMAALFGALDVSQKAYGRATSAEEAQVAARATLDRLATDLRMVGSFYFGAGNAGFPITAFGSTSISFWGDVNGDGSTTTTAAATATGITLASATGFTQNELVYVGSGAFREVATIASDPSSSTTLTLSAPPAAGTWTALANSYPANSMVRSVEQVTWSYDAAARTLTRTEADSGAVTVMDNVVAFSLAGYDVNGTATTTLSAIDSIGVALTVEDPRGARRTLGVRVQLRSMRVG
ncbi:MAG: type II secretion system protein [Candidatus Rokubacteria bacterium]|nr:type II secretion system protein [Candidatus Rokubacteria bacterium]